ncbi:MAG: ASF1 anti-silencing function 1, partial [Marteilia pararefringens]
GRAPDCTKIRPQDLLGVTLVILEFSFCDQIFANCGFILRNFYEDPELEANPPEVPQFKKIRREIIKSAKINCFNINWTQDTKLEESGQCKSNMRNSEDLQQAVNSSFKENCGNLFLEKKRLVDKEENKETTDDDNKIKNSSRQATLDSPSFF